MFMLPPTLTFRHFPGTVAFTLVLLLSISSRPDFPTYFFSEESRALDREAQKLQDAIPKSEFQRVLDRAPELIRRSREQARPDAELRVRRLEGAAHLGLGQYREALAELTPLRPVARRRCDYRSLWSIDTNIAWVYLKMNNLDAALPFADEAVWAQKQTGKANPNPLRLRALISSTKGDFREAIPFYSEAINMALDARDWNSAEAIWQYLGASSIKAGLVSQARTAETEAFRIHSLHRGSDADMIDRDLARVLASSGDLDMARLLMDRGLKEALASTEASPVWTVYRDRGRLEELEGKQAAAVADYGRALEATRNLEVVATDDDRIAFESGVQEAFSLFIDASTRLGIEKRDRQLIEAGFNASEENRAASLRALVPQPRNPRTALPEQHQRALESLEAAERAALVNPSPKNETAVKQIKRDLHIVESQAGAYRRGEAGSALKNARAALDPDSAVLAFHLGAKTSWLWAITEREFQAYPLPASDVIARSATHLRTKMESGRDADAECDALGGLLFGKLSNGVLKKHRWIVALDQDLFAVPLGALRLHGQYVVHQHSVLLTPSVSLLKPADERGELKGPLLGVGDAIYNTADPRWPKPFWVENLFRRAKPSLELARLSGSAQEIQAALHGWGTGEALTGRDASKQSLERVSSLRPAVLHLATHVVRTSEYRSGVIVMSLNPNGVPELLSMRDIVVQSAAPLVVMSGCGSGQADALPASGLMGLTRAWIAAGASDVLATLWPSLDDSGPFFASFYKNLRTNPAGGPAEALHRAQLEMMASATFRHSPQYWASYFLVGRM